MDFIRNEKNRSDYNPNKRHCLYGQDGDLIMLGLASHEPHFCLLREEVVFNQERKRAILLKGKEDRLKEEEDMRKYVAARKKEQGLVEEEEKESKTSEIVSASLSSYMNNSNFELLHMSILRDYISYEFETSDVLPKSPFRLEPTIDDFVFMTFFVGNDFLPHMPAMDIGDEAFDFLFYVYKRGRHTWLKDNMANHIQECDDGRFVVTDRGSIEGSDDMGIHIYNKDDAMVAKDYNTTAEEGKYPYLTYAGTITSGQRLESFLTDLGQYEDPYYDNKKRNSTVANSRMRSADRKAGRESYIPTEEDLELREKEGRLNYRDMLERIVDQSGSGVDGGDFDSMGSTTSGTNGDATLAARSGKTNFTPVTSKESGRLIEQLSLAQKKNSYNDNNEEGKFSLPVTQFQQSNVELDVGFLPRMGELVRNSLSPASGTEQRSSSSRLVRQNRYDRDDFSSALQEHETDLKGRYYFDKLNLGPFDAEEHLALRKAYIEGLVWNLDYYYKGCASWEWFYPYNYGPMLSDLVNIESILTGISFENDKSKPLKPFEQLLGCLPSSSAHLLPEPYAWLMKSSKSPIIDFYPENFTVDMNGKRWPWEAVVLLPFINSERLLDSVKTLISDGTLSEGERSRNKIAEPIVLQKDNTLSVDINALSEGKSIFGPINGCHVRTSRLKDTQWSHSTNEHENARFKPELLPYLQSPLAGFPTLKEASVQGMVSRKVGINIFGMKSRYKTAVLQLDKNIPVLPSATALASKFIGTTVYFRYPILQEGFVTAISDSAITVRGKDSPRHWNKNESKLWSSKNSKLCKSYETGSGQTGSGGVNLPNSSIMISLRPLKEIQNLSDGSKVKIYAKLEVEVPMLAVLWSPTQPDPRFVNIPARLESNPYRFFNKLNVKNISIGKETSSIPLSKSSPNTPASILPLNSDNVIDTKKIDMNITATLNDDVVKVNILPHSSRENKSTLDFNSITPMSILPSSNSIGEGKATTNNKLASNSNIGEREQVGILPPSTIRNSKIQTQGLLLSKVGGKSRSFSTLSSCCHKYRVIQAPTPKVSPFSRNVSTFSSRRPLPTSNQKRPTTILTMIVVSFLSSIIGNNADSSHMFNNQNKFGIGLTNGYNKGDITASHSPPPLEFEHGTTTISFIFDGGIVAAVDSRASIGNFVGSKTVQKVLPVTKHIIGTMAGGAADCSFWIRKLQAEARLHELVEGRAITVARASQIIANFLYEYKSLDLSVGTMIMGFDEFCGSSIYYVDNNGVRIQGDMFAVGSGSTFAQGILDTEMTKDMKMDEAISLGIKAIRHATFRDAFSGGFIAVYVITSKGWKKVFSEDLALSSEKLFDEEDSQ